MTSLNEGTNSDAIEGTPDEGIIQEFEDLDMAASGVRDRAETFDSHGANDGGEESWINPDPPKPSQPTPMAPKPAPTVPPECSMALGTMVPSPINQHAFPTLHSDLQVTAPSPQHARRSSTHRSRSIRTSKETVIGIGTR